MGAGVTVEAELIGLGDGAAVAAATLSGRPPARAQAGASWRSPAIDAAPSID